MISKTGGWNIPHSQAPNEPQYFMFRYKAWSAIEKIRAI